jgi:hypothetical protein
VKLRDCLDGDMKGRKGKGRKFRRGKGREARVIMIL